MAPRSYQAHIHIDRRKAEKFLNDLATNENFYKRVQADPFRVLREKGIDLSPMPPGKITLPPQAEIRKFVKTVLPKAKTLTGGGPFGFLVSFVVMSGLPHPGP